MIRFLARLERKKTVWLLTGFCLVFFFLRLPSIIEPYWYGDEGVYEVIGQAMDHGRLLYRDIWDNKPPLLYTIYALAQGDQSTTKIISIIAGMLSLIAFFLLTQKIFNKVRISILASSIFIIFLGTPILEGNIANAEVFLLPFTIFAGLLIYQFTNKKLSTFNFQLLTLTAGLLLGIALLFKIVAIFDFAAFFLFILLFDLPKDISWIAIKKAFTNF